MTIARKISFVPTQKPIRALATKFGGQPTWLSDPQWPLSQATGKPMRFIGQIALEPPAFEPGQGKMAYVFMTDDLDEYVDGTWEPDGGENAVILQPGSYTGSFASLAQGPTLYRMIEKPGFDSFQPESVEFAVDFLDVEEPPFQPEAMQADWTQEQSHEYASALEGSKVGGTPLFLQGDEFPDGQDWRLLLQLDSAAVPFFVNFGDAGIAYVFIDQSASKGKMLWQCG